MEQRHVLEDHARSHRVVWISKYVRCSWHRRSEFFNLTQLSVGNNNRAAAAGQDVADTNKKNTRSNSSRIFGLRRPHRFRLTICVVIVVDMFTCFSWNLDLWLLFIEKAEIIYRRNCDCAFSGYD